MPHPWATSRRGPKAFKAGRYGHQPLTIQASTLRGDLSAHSQSSIAVVTIASYQPQGEDGRGQAGEDGTIRVPPESGVQLMPQTRVASTSSSRQHVGWRNVTGSGTQPPAKNCA
ncbi:hypothetical protein JDV02_005250 [Purpureocillium takamizusanense]|uniref:Uncharacterized protein n=1 Tax=Purpureocillium takamizusanense TaxID=2060973 RepID=A0A9Q8QGZ4_9HYPO|nr:uncharacterized protein JDV02_005250 [Purpureocillium takamizusanense]UNI19031.1 hypothetical protein JDV02_005250 [Purpureocillium takamizusanense]